MAEPAPELALAAICRELARLGRRFALVGGLAVSVRAEVRFTRDVDLVVPVSDDAEAESLIFELRSAGYSAVASVEHEAQHRLSTIRLMSPSRVKVDLLFASSGIEKEIVDGASPIDLGPAGMIPVASAEELLAMKILSMTDTRLQDRIDAQRLLQFTPTLDVSRVREHLARITERGYAREQDLEAKTLSCFAMLAAKRERRDSGRAIERIERVAARRRLNLFAGLAEAALFAVVDVDGLKQRRCREVGPHARQKDELGVRRLEEQKVAHARFAAGTNQQVDVRQGVRGHLAVEEGFVDLFR